MKIGKYREVNPKTILYSESRINCIFNFLFVFVNIHKRN